MKISEAQKIVKNFAEKNGWKDEPNIDKFDHIHEELVEMSQFLRYKSPEEMKKIIIEKKESFEDGIGDVLFATLRLANQLGIDAEKSFEDSAKRIIKDYTGSGKENNLTMTRIRDD